MSTSTSASPASASSSYKAQQATIASMSIFEKLDTIPAIMTVSTKTVLALVTGPFKSKESRPKSYYRYVMLTVMRAFTARTSTRQQHYLCAPTDDGYVALCKKFSLTPRSEVLEDGTKAHWIGDSKAEKLIMNFHGGGYAIPPPPGMFEFMLQIVLMLNKQGKSVSCLFLSYDLAPTAPYPRQLQQASHLLLHVLNNLHYSPSNIILTGDSAGANLAVALLSHITHPHPSTTTPIPKITLSTPLAGCVLTSPWVSFIIDSPSVQRNQGKDCVSISAGKKWSTSFLHTPWPHTSSSDPYNQPSSPSVPLSWFSSFPSACSSILIVCGSDEVMFDGIIEFKSKLVAAIGEERVDFVVGEGEYHDMPSLDLDLGYKETDEGVQAREIKRWISSKL